MSHELRTPLNAVIGFSELLAASALGESATRHAEHIHAAGNRLSAVVNEMIRLSEGGNLSADPSVQEHNSEPVAPVCADADERTLRVLCVDDNSRNRDLITAVLTAQGVECQTANDGAEALAAVAAGRFDLVLMDIQMPVMNGVEATRAIRALPQDQAGVPIVAVTANTLADQLVEYAQAGINDCIAKPFALTELLGKVAQWTDIANDAGPVTRSA
jgi:CheY-like chemotaxis protein